MAEPKTFIYRIPIAPRTGRNRTASKGYVALRIVYVAKGKRRVSQWLPETAETEVIRIEAGTNAEAYDKLCAAFLPKDTRPITGRSFLRNFRTLKT